MSVTHDVRDNTRLLEEFKNNELPKVFTDFNNERSKKSIEVDLEERFADFYHRKLNTSVDL